ncbi:MAG: glycosyltransferase family 2 protein [Isosphaeraceae bacterium]
MTTVDPRVSIVMITHDRAPEVLRSLEHLSRLPEQPRLILVDNGSTDGTIAQVSERFPEVELIASRTNLGAAGRTLGIDRAHTPYVALCDDDTWWEPGSLGQAASLLENHPRLAILTGRVLVGPEDREDPICRELARSPLPDEPDLPGYPLMGFLAGASVVRRSAFLDAGGFESRFFIGGEEELLALDLITRGWSLRYVPELVVHHHPSPRRNVPSRRCCLLRNALWSAWLRRPLGSAIRQTIRLVRAAPRDRTMPMGLGQAIVGLPWVMRERRVVPPCVEHRLRLLEASRQIS